MLFMDRLKKNTIKRKYKLFSVLFLFGLSAELVHCHNLPQEYNIQGLGVWDGLYNTHSNVTSFLGIPYAEPPIGKLRFEKPQAVSLNGSLNATKMPPSCMHTNSKSSTLAPTMSEDCLYLNIYIPRNMSEPNANRSVMVWINSEEYLFTPDMKTLASKGDVIVVNVNYRLGIFGFLSTGDATFPGNAGLHDQVMALKWVKANIYAFGGDPEKIAIFGQSSAAVSIYVLISSPTITNGLFSRAIMQSGMVGAITNPGKAFWLVAKLTSCPHIHLHGQTHAFALRKQIECMQNKTTEELSGVELKPNAPIFGPIIDKVFLNSSILEQLATNKMNIPTLIGLNNNEFVFNANDSIEDIDALKKHLSSFGGQTFNNLSVELMLSKFLLKDLQKTYMDVINSQMLVFIQNVAIRLSGAKDAYMYFFNKQPSFSTSENYAGARNSEELPFIFGNVFKMPSTTSGEEMLSNDMISIWSSFARDGVPQLPGGIKWPPFEKTNRTYVELNVNITADNVKQRLRESDRIFWNELMPALLKMATKPPDSDITHHHMMTTDGNHHHHQHTDSSKFAWGMSDQAVQDLLLSLLIVLIFVTVICATLIIILCKVRTIKLAATQTNNVLNVAPATGNVNKAFMNEATKSKPESITAL